MRGKIKVVGLGAGDIEQLPLGVYRLLVQVNEEIYVRTTDHPVLAELEAEGVRVRAFDHYYEAEETFEAVYEKIVARLIEAANEGTIIYAVPGHPMLAERTVALLLAQTDVKIEIVGGHSYLDDLFTALEIDPIDGFQFIDGTDFTRDQLQYDNHIVFCQVYDAYIASEVKLTLLEDLPFDYEVTIIEAAGTVAEKKLVVRLEELDRVMEMSNLVSVYVPPVPTELLDHTFANLRKVIATLRGEGGCPWDRKQTHESLREYAIEEVYELIDAINQGDDEAIIGELGDVLLQVMLHSQIGEDDGYFSIDDVIAHLTKKMIHRHPNVFGGEDKEKTWDQLKEMENPALADENLLDSVIMEAPALQVAYKLQRKAAKVGFNWSDLADIWEKFAEEKAEFIAEVSEEDRRKMEEELGDMFFVLVNVALFHKLNPEIALKQANEKFRNRFTYVEEQVNKSGVDWPNTSFDKLDEYWKSAKEEEK